MAAKRKRKSSSNTKTIVRTVRAPTPVVKVMAPRAVAAPKRRSGGRRRHHSGGGLNLLGGHGLPATVVGVGIGGAALGFIEKTFPNLPTVPLIGRKGTITIAAYFLAKRGGSLGGIARDIAIAGAAISGYELGHDGHVTGEIPSQVRGLAAQV